MLDPQNDLLPQPSSSTISSSSSSDLDTESTGSFFHDRSTSLGTLMGVTFPPITFRQPPRRMIQPAPVIVSSHRRSTTARRRRWWMPCKNDGALRSASLGEFLEVERRYGDGAFFEAAVDLERAVAMRQPRGRGVGRNLFINGEILPPRVHEAQAAAGALCKFPVLIAGICCGSIGG